MIALRLAKEGYWGGDPERVLNGRVDLVLEAAEYEVFISKYIEAGAGS